MVVRFGVSRRWCVPAPSAILIGVPTNATAGQGSVVPIGQGHRITGFAVERLFRRKFQVVGMLVLVPEKGPC